MDRPARTAQGARPLEARSQTHQVLHRRAERWRLAKFATVGASNTVIDTVLFTLLTVLGAWYVAAKVIAFAVATVNGYFWNRRWTFRGATAAPPVFGRYLTVQGLTLGLNVGLLALAVEGFGLHPVPAQSLCLPVSFGLAYLGQRLWTFPAHLHGGATPHRTAEEPVVGPV